MKRWKPPLDTTRKEQLLLKRLTRTKKLFAFLRLHRHELFNDEFQAELEGMYRSTGAGCEPLAPALMCMISLLQAYTDTSDAEAVELTVVDARWQMVLDCMNAERRWFRRVRCPRFALGAGLDRRLLERTVELAKQTKEFDWKKLPKELRVAMDSRPLKVRAEWGHDQPSRSRCTQDRPTRREGDQAFRRDRRAELQASGVGGQQIARSCGLRSRDR